MEGKLGAPSCTSPCNGFSGAIAPPLGTSKAHLWGKDSCLEASDDLSLLSMDPHGGKREHIVL